MSVVVLVLWTSAGNYFHKQRRIVLTFCPLKICMYLAFSPELAAPGGMHCFHFPDSPPEKLSVTAIWHEKIVSAQKFVMLS